MIENDDFLNMLTSPLNLPFMKNILVSNPIDIKFDPKRLFEIKMPEEKINPIFEVTSQKSYKKRSQIELCPQPKFLMHILPTEGVKYFNLDLDANEKDENNSDESNSTQLLLQSKLKCKSKIKKNPTESKFDSQFVKKLDQLEQMPPFSELIKEPAWAWTFEPDVFQKQAIIALENNHSVFVAAHTSAGKTVVAEYAIGMCQNRGARIIYTSPIKALSNQKYREFKSTFGQDKVGLLTGDIKTGTQRYILVMTTEILHNMLKNNCPTLKDLEMVVMDEVHYLNDEARGHIWEQIMILLPKRIQLVMLSATVPNTMQFAQWLGHIRNTQVHVISTLKRPVPLWIFLYLGTGRNSMNDMYLMMKQKSQFNMLEYNRAVDDKKKKQQKFHNKSGGGANAGGFKQQDFAKMQQRENQKQFKHQVKGATNNKSGRVPDGLKNEGKLNEKGKDYNQWCALFEMLQSKNNLPVIVFMFSRKRIEATVYDFSSLDFLTKAEKSSVHKFYSDIIRRKLINSKDREIFQVVQLQNLLERGIGVHHAGLLPILKEIVEILFSRGFVKILFATETFAVGVNMPAKSVVFDSLMKFDRNGKRMLTSGEFTQMAGRAGRRGLDDVGNVIIMVKSDEDVPVQENLRKVMLGEASSLQSKFKISYNMILSLYRSRQFNMVHMIRHSFIEADRLNRYESNCDQLEDARQQLILINDHGSIGKCQEENCDGDTLDKYFDDCCRYRDVHSQLWSWIETDISQKVLTNSLLQLGRLILWEPAYSRRHNKTITTRTIYPGFVLEILKPMNGCDKYLMKILTVTQNKDDYSPRPMVIRSTKIQQLQAYLSGDVSSDVNSAPPLVDPEHNPLITGKIGTDLIPMLVTIRLNEIYRICQYKHQGINLSTITKHWNTQYCSRDGSHVNSVEQSMQWIRRCPQLEDILNQLVSCNMDQLNSVALDKELNVKDATTKQFLNEYMLQDTPGLGPISFYECLKCSQISEHMEQLHRSALLIDRIKKLELELSDDNLIFLPEYSTKVRLLKTLQYIYDDNREVIDLKGRVACEIESYELVITELLFSGIFLEIDAWDIAAGLSCLVFESKASLNTDFDLRTCSEGLRKIIDAIYKTVDMINKLQIDMSVDGADSIELNCGLVLSLEAWTKNPSNITFSDIADMTDAQCGDIVRCILRLTELMRHCEAASKVIPNFLMAHKFKGLADILSRGVVATPSLYVDE